MHIRKFHEHGKSLLYVLFLHCLYTLYTLKIICMLCLPGWRAPVDWRSSPTYPWTGEGRWPKSCQKPARDSHTFSETFGISVVLVIKCLWHDVFIIQIICQWVPFLSLNCMLCLVLAQVASNMLDSNFYCQFSLKIKIQKLGIRNIEFSMLYRCDKCSVSDIICLKAWGLCEAFSMVQTCSWKFLQGCLTSSG